MKTQEDYKADGWLGILVGKKLYFECFDQQMAQNVIGKLSIELKRKAMRTAGPIPVAGLPLIRGDNTPVGGFNNQRFLPKRSTSEASSIANYLHSLEEVKKWSDDEVKEWFKQKKLSYLYKIKFHKVNSGPMLYQLVYLYRKSPQVFIVVLEKFGVSDPTDILSFTLALDEL